MNQSAKSLMDPPPILCFQTWTENGCVLLHMSQSAWMDHPKNVPHAFLLGNPLVALVVPSIKRKDGNISLWK